MTSQPYTTVITGASKGIGYATEHRLKMIGHQVKRVPMQRLAQPDEIAAAIAFFASEDTSYITGQTLFVDGVSSLGSA